MSHFEADCMLFGVDLKITILYEVGDLIRKLEHKTSSALALNRKEGSILKNLGLCHHPVQMGDLQ